MKTARSRLPKREREAAKAARSEIKLASKRRARADLRAVTEARRGHGVEIGSDQFPSAFPDADGNPIVAVDDGRLTPWPICARG